MSLGLRKASLKERVRASILVSSGREKYDFMDSTVAAIISSEMPWFFTAQDC